MVGFSLQINTSAYPTTFHLRESNPEWQGI